MPKRKKAPTKQKQKQSQRQSVVVNIGAPTGKSKPRKSSGRGNLPPPSYAHNLAPTFITAPQVDYTPILGAIAGHTAKLNQEPRIQNPITPLSTSVQATQTAPSQTAQQMAGEAALRRAEKTAGNFQEHPSQVRAKVELPEGAPLPLKTQKESITFTPKEKTKKQGFKPITILGGEQKGFEPKVVVNAPRGPAEEPSRKRTTGLQPKSSEIQIQRTRQQTIQRKEKLDDIKRKVRAEGREALTDQEIDFVKKAKGTAKLQRQLGIVD